MEKRGVIDEKTPDDQKSDEKRAGADSKDHAADRAADAVEPKKQ